jgi:4-amino-4-deoxy-L-arabinose transferase-like glycosyltransferase
LTGLARSPVLHNDEVSILAAGYNLFEHGVYGVDMYAGWHGRESIYLEILPLMPWMQGLGSWLWGAGVWQMRLLPVFCGVLTLALAFALARQLGGRLAAALAMLLLLAWQWSPGGVDFFGSGVALVDLARIGRYDILAAPLSFGIMLTWLVARRTDQTWFYLLCGLLIGLAGLAQLYGLFWLAVVVAWCLGERIAWGTSATWRQIMWLFAVALGAMLVWLTLALAHWPEFRAQFGMHQSRFELLDPLFYVNNIITEGQRYFLGFNQPGTFGRLGFWLVVVGLPLALFWLSWRVVRWRERPAFWLLIPCLLLPLLFALLVQKKQFAYLLLVMPLWVVALAWLLAYGWQRARPYTRTAVVVLVGLLLVEGGLAWREFYHTAVTAPSPLPFFATLQEKTPDGRVLGPQTYWLAFPEREYRSFVVPLVLAAEGRDGTDSFVAAMTAVTPDVVLLNPTILAWLADGQYEAEFWQYMTDHQAELVAELPAYDGGVAQIYQLR